MTVLIGDCCAVMPDHAPFYMILSDRPYGDTALGWDRRYIGCEIDAQMAACANARIDAALLLGSPLPKLNPPSGETQ